MSEQKNADRDNATRSILDALGEPVTNRYVEYVGHMEEDGIPRGFWVLVDSATVSGFAVAGPFSTEAEAEAEMDRLNADDPGE